MHTDESSISDAGPSARYADALKQQPWVEQSRLSTVALELARSETRPYEDVPPLPLMTASLETLSCPRVAVHKGLQHKGGCGQVCSGVVASMG